MNMTGEVESLHALLPVIFRLPGRPDSIIKFVVDTGFTGFLTLPPAAVTAMGLSHVTDQESRLADDSITTIPVYSVTIVWKGVEIEARVLAMGRRPLLGTALLADSQLLTQFVEGGLVTVEDMLHP